MDVNELERALRAARFRAGERFEVAVRSADGVLRARPFAAPAPAAAWLGSLEGDKYLGLSPLAAAASFPPGRARDADVAVVRMLLVDCDPETADTDAAGELADAVAARLASLGARPARIHTGRGRQLWLEHEPLLVSDPRLAIRARLVRALAARFDLAGRAHVDPVVHNPARLARLPGSLNSRTGGLAVVEDPGESSALLLADLERLTLEFEAEANASRPSRPARTAHAFEPGNGSWPASYVAAAVRRILAKMHEAAEGRRNDTLNKCAFSLGQLEGGGAGVASALDELRDAALAAGLDEREVEKTIRSGWDAGLADPRPAPQPKVPRCEKRAREALSATSKPRDRARVGLTDLGNARRLVRKHGADLRFSAAAGGWFAWDGKRWRRDETGEAQRRAKTVPRRILLRAARLFRQAALTRKEDKRAAERLAERAEALRKHGIKTESERALKAILAIAQTEPGIPVLADELDADPWLLNVENGTLDLRTGTLQKFKRTDLITKMAPVAFEPAAACPTWTAFLERVLPGSPELLAFLQRAVGYALTGQTSEQVLFLLYGTGANGKSTFVETIRALLGDYSLQASFDTFLVNDQAQQNSVARLRGARFVSAVEAEAGGRLNETLVKTLTGGDTIAARFLYREHFEFRPAFKLFLAANHKPIVRGNDRAIWRRIRLVPFTVTIPDAERDAKLKEKLQAELPGILNWAVEGCLAWQREGLGQPPEVAAATAEYRDDMDTLAGFLAERCETFPDSRVGSAELYKAYAAWSDANGEKPMTQTSFSLRLGERGFERKRSGGNGSRVWYGVSLATGQRALLTPPDELGVSSGKFPGEENRTLQEVSGTDGQLVSPPSAPTGQNGALAPGWVEEPEEH